MPTPTRRRLVTALGSIAVLGLLGGCAETDEDDGGLEDDEESGEDEAGDD